MKPFDWGLEGARANGSICVLEYEDGQAFVVAEVFGEIGESPTEFAPSHDRARLIAAAPDLYEALAVFAKCADELEATGEFRMLTDDYRRACAALAKANGGAE